MVTATVPISLWKAYEITDREFHGYRPPECEAWLLKTGAKIYWRKKGRRHRWVVYGYYHDFSDLKPYLTRKQWRALNDR